LTASSEAHTLFDGGLVEAKMPFKIPIHAAAAAHLLKAIQLDPADASTRQALDRAAASARAAGNADLAGRIEARLSTAIHKKVAHSA
jgi:hypothetical protein